MIKVGMCHENVRKILAIKLKRLVIEIVYSFGALEHAKIDEDGLSTTGSESVT